LADLIFYGIHYRSTRKIGQMSEVAVRKRLVLFVDADNTLWDTDGVFATAQLNLLTAVESAIGSRISVADRLAFVRQIDQALAELHHRGLRYPPRLLAAAVARALAGEKPEAAARITSKEGPGTQLVPAPTILAIEDTFIAELRHSPELLPGVRAGLARLHEHGALIFIVTEAAKARVRKTANEHCLTELFDRIIESPKSKRLFERVQKLRGVTQPAFMIGDQLQRDISPAKAAGLITIYVPGRFRPRWEPNEAAVGPAFRASRFDDAVDIVFGQRERLNSLLTNA
jgi:putative hydrolase of the HAD superfamily